MIVWTAAICQCFGTWKAPRQTPRQWAVPTILLGRSRRYTVTPISHWHIVPQTEVLICRSRGTVAVVGVGVVRFESFELHGSEERAEGDEGGGHNRYTGFNQSPYHRGCRWVYCNVRGYFSKEKQPYVDCQNSRIAPLSISDEWSLLYSHYGQLLTLYSKFQKDRDRLTRPP